ncbi:hypothetical protein HHK36_017643 [Tetracentron sinense]|uniref:Uncharacterized protein n=1 Tax=Tetracentron sinense TaxID=13715 RepID=A0A835DAJ2_TETSI|nr:hypothetical protein HHK36_017643 [Tetracentron sinense]
MSVSILNGPTVTEFVEDGDAFDKSNGDQKRKRAVSMTLSLRNGTIDPEEFRSEMKEIMLAVARGIGNSPVQVALETESLLMRAV